MSKFDIWSYRGVRGHGCAGDLWRSPVGSEGWAMLETGRVCFRKILGHTPIRFTEAMEMKRDVSGCASFAVHRYLKGPGCPLPC